MATGPSPKTKYPPDITDGERQSLVLAIKDWSMAHGLAIRPPPSIVPQEVDPHGITAINAPVTLFPSPFPRRCFDQARVAQKPYNELYARISRDEEFLARAVKDVVNTDDFIASLWKVHLRVKEEGYTQPLSLGMFRSDYMVHQEEADSSRTMQAKQVEFNTIASSFGGLSSLTSQLHWFLAKTEYPLLQPPILPETLSLPANNSTLGLAAGIAAAFEHYGASDLGLSRCVIFLIQAGERNVFDQRHLEHALQSSPAATAVFRLAFGDIKKYTSVACTPKRQLLYQPPHNDAKVFEVSVVYLRSGYGPSDYPDESAWEARYHLERSAAIKCPTVLTQVAGMKKVQQLLATPKAALSTSILGPTISQCLGDYPELRHTFTNIYPMDDSSAGLEARKLALDPEACKAYVLKPQREGGGNNIYRTAIPVFLKSIPESHWSAYILMELITPPAVANVILRNGHVEKGGVICELGIYGTCVWDQVTGRILHNEEAGYLLRTKGDKSEEGGVAAGFGCMDSCSLI